MCFKIVINLLNSDAVSQEVADVLLTALGTMLVNDKNVLRVARKDCMESIKTITAKHNTNPKSGLIMSAVSAN